MGMRLGVNKIAQLVSEATPRSEVSRPFVLAENDGGVTPDIIGNPATGTTRMFVVRPSDQLAKDDGEAGTPAGRLTAIVEVKVVYLFRDLDIARLNDLMQEDCATIQRALQNHLAWDCPTTGIISIAPAEQPFRDPLEQDNPAGTTEVGFVLTIPSPVTYREVPL